MISAKMKIFSATEEQEYSPIVGFQTVMLNGVYLEVTSSGAVNDGCLLVISSVLGPGLLGDEAPQLVKVDAGLDQVGVVGVHVEVPHANLSKVSRMVFVKVDSVVVLSSSVSTTSRMLPVLANPSVSVRHVTSQLPGLLLAG